MTYRVLDQVHVTAHIHGDSLDLDLEPGDVDVLPEIGELLVAQGFAVVVADEDQPQAVEELPADETPAEEPPAEEPARKASKSRTNTPEA